MPLDPAIPLQVRQPSINTPFQGLGEAMQLRQAQQQMANSQALEQERRQKLAQSATLDKQNTTIDGLMNTAFKADPDTGVFTFDRPTFEQGLVQSGMGHLYPQMAEHLDKLDESTAKLTKARNESVARSLVGIGDAGYTPEAFLTAAAYLKKNGAITDAHLQPVQAAVAADPSPENIKSLVMKLGGGMPEYQQLIQAGDTRKAGLAKTQAETGQITANTAKTNMETAGTLPQTPAQLAAQANTIAQQTETARHNQATEAQGRASLAQAGTGNTDARDAVAGMKEGTLPPLLPGRASKEYTAMMAEAKRQGYDLAGAATDWVATQKHIATLNNNQQTKLQQSMQTAAKSVDVIDDLAKQWDGGKYPVLNAVTLKLAKGGALGPDAQSIATKLDGQITDVTSELAQVYMGGGTPTDQALKLASQNLQGSWSKKTLLDMTDLTRQNLKIRSNSMKNVGVQGASENNPYAPKVAPDATTGPKPGDVKPLQLPSGAMGESTFNGTTWIRSK